MSAVVAVLGIFLPVVIVSVFGFLSVFFWADARRREREAFYRSETLKKIADATEPGASAALEVMREQDRREHRRRREDHQLGGLVASGVGVALMVFLRGIVKDEVPVYLVGLIPLLAGVALLIYGYVLSPRERA